MNALELKSSTNLHDISHKEIALDGYITNNKLITNSSSSNLLTELKLALSECTSFYFSVAFINFSGIQLLLDSLKDASDRGVHGKIMTSTYLNFTEPKALEKIKTFENIDLNIFIATNELGFHTKAYIFENTNDYKIIIGSSNITQRALKSNIEWNVMSISKKDESFLKEILEEYNLLWNKTNQVDVEFLNRYNDFLNKLKSRTSKDILIFDSYEKIHPNYMQKKAIANLKHLRSSGENKALVIAATGSGKTYMAAFDVLEFNPKRVLFLVHREDILKNAKKTFQKLVSNKNKSFGLLTGTSKDLDSDYLFSTNHSLINVLNKFPANHFDYIIVDEAHHVSANSYKTILNHFKPKFTLGMTATPERCDGESIFEFFDENIALEIRLREALEKNLIIPFHYFGITDIESIDLSTSNLDNISELSKLLSINKRVDFIIDKMKFYGFDGAKRRCVGFCVNKEHARYMNEQFNLNGIPSTCLTSDNTSIERSNAIHNLESDSNPLEVIFTVDLFNEGVDIPSINLVLMLRPTESPIVFIQQLGRGLRKHVSKEFLTVLDFIGNHNKAFLIAIALNGARYYDKDSLKVSVETDFANIGGCTNIQMDKISKERILQQLDIVNFNSMKYLKDEYFNFKILNGGRFSYYLQDYLKFDGSIDPIRFINKEKTYLSFLNKMEKSINLDYYISNVEFMNLLKYLSNMLPLKTPYEFVILKSLLKSDILSIDNCKMEIKKTLNNVSNADIIHSINYLNGTYSDSREIKSNPKILSIIDSNTISLTLECKKLICDAKFKSIIEDTLNYGILRYTLEFGNEYYGIPFLKPYSQYQMIDIALLSNYEKTLSSFRGSGLLTNKKDFFLFIDLHKDANIKDSINYDDKFLNQHTFQWQTPNNTRQNTDRGKNIINNKEYGVKLHLFIRKYKQIDGVTQPYIYIGKGNTISYEGNQPITTIIELENKVPNNIYTEFITKI